MALADILKARAKIIKPVEQVEKKESEIQISIYSEKTPDPDVFFLTYSFWLKNPLRFDWYLHRDFYAFLLGDSHFVRGVFTPCSEEKIFQLYQRKLGELTFTELQRLIFFISSLCSNCPRSFEDRIINFIERNLNESPKEIS